jgi:hypothetical protein
MSSNHPELVDLRECLEAHRDNENLMYLTDREPTLQPINKWIGDGAKFRLTRSPGGDVLKTIIIKLQKRVKSDTSTPCPVTSAYEANTLHKSGARSTYQGMGMT